MMISYNMKIFSIIIMILVTYNMLLLPLQNRDFRNQPALHGQTGFIASHCIGLKLLFAAAMYMLYMFMFGK